MDDKPILAIKELTKAYAKQLPKKIAEIEVTWLLLQANNTPELFAKLKMEAHSLTGTAGTYGYKLISELSRALEKALLNLRLNYFTHKDINEIEHIIVALRQSSHYPPEEIIHILQDESMDDMVKKKIYLLTDMEFNEVQINQIDQFNYSVRVFANFHDFIDMVFKEHPHVVIIDINFANQLTEDIIHKFREEIIFIIYLGDRDDLPSRLEALRHGGQAFIVKPLDTNILLRMVDNYFEAKKSEAERILIVDDSEFLADYYTAILSSAKMITEKVSNPNHFLSVLQEFQPDLVLMDVNMPMCSGTELAQIVNQQENLSGIPIIYLSTISEKSKQLEALSFAGDDFLTKPVEPKYLIATVRNRLMRSRMLRSRMMRDSLTNLYNHTMIHHQLEREIVIAHRYQRELCVALLDIDYFKSVNDLYGHQAGDRILKEMSLFLLNHLRRTDLIGRYGGEEFLIVFPNTDLKKACQIMEDLLREFSSIPHKLGDKEVFITFSAGLANYPRVLTSTDLVKVADQGLYRAKDEGRNRILVGDNKQPQV